MFKFTRTGVFCLSIIILFLVIQIFISQYSIQTEINEEIMYIKSVEKLPVVEKTNKCEIWQIEIPEISLIAYISEGTTKEILNQYVGHFENTSKEQGNIGLAAYNRGHDVNYFKDLKLLKEGDEIRYKHNEFEKIYEVEKCRIIKDTEWKYLEQTEDNMLTLITFVENEPKYRRCILAEEKEVDEY